MGGTLPSSRAFSWIREGLRMEGLQLFRFPVDFGLKSSASNASSAPDFQWISGKKFLHFLFQVSSEFLA
ncbi:hypothetical protein KSP39_PZI020450 [Platanthera zijinensis]|uniref:Uncharacterized protein n=1 Tax=Platanthera zijinensis TaxID=2320716 RepID=A0AAP0FXL0_9ASPA